MHSSNDKHRFNPPMI